MSYTMSDLLFGVGGTQALPTGGMCLKVSSREDMIQMGGLQKLSDAILELSRNYRFQGLERTGPLVNLLAGQAAYPTSYFTNDDDEIVNLIPSFYINYANIGYTPGYFGGYQAGSQLIWKSVDSLELMMQITPGTPAYFTRYGDNFLIAPTPYAINTAFLRYQVEHPFSTPVALTDPFMLPNEWREIAEYAGALRFAADTRMLDYAKQYHDILFGDPAGRGDVGLIARRITQIEGDSTANTAMRSIRVNVSRY